MERLISLFIGFIIIYTWVLSKVFELKVSLWLPYCLDVYTDFNKNLDELNKSNMN